MITSTIKMTAEQYLLLKEDPPGVRLELVDGEIAVSPSPTPGHSRVVSQLGAMLIAFVETRGLGEVLLDVDTIFGEYDVRRPDILYFSKGRTNLITEKRLLGKPDLAVEVVSPSSTKTDKADKFKQYAAGGVKFYWIVDPAKESFDAYLLKARRYLSAAHGQSDDVISAPPFDALKIPLNKLWWK